MMFWMWVDWNIIDTCGPSKKVRINDLTLFMWVVALAQDPVHSHVYKYDREFND